jgi:glyceraldehyde 3-phosphate dehydrogenase
MIRVGINGFGRIGRNTLRAALEHSQYAKKFEIVAINDLGNNTILAHLLKYDSTYGKFDGEINVRDDGMEVNGRFINFFSQVNPSNIPWGKHDIDVVVESTGVFRSRDDVTKHLDAGAKKVIISAPAKDPDITIVLGVNENMYDANKHRVISNASCTTNCVAPVAKVLHENFGLVNGLMMTAHAYTNDQRIQDLIHSDMRRARAGAINIIPTTTGAAVAATLVLPELAGRMNGISLRVPVPDVSVVDLTCTLEKSTTKEEINAAFKKAAEGPLKGILEYTEDPVVSSDFLHSTCSAAVDAQSTMVLGGNFVKVLAWYDNEWGFSCRMTELIELVGSKAGF